MTQIPILNGVYMDGGLEPRSSFPINLVPTPKDSGISQGYLRPADGIVSQGTGPGLGRGGINWNEVCYRVMGTKLVSISSAGAVTTLGDVGGGGEVTLTYSFDRLAIASGGKLFFWNGTTLTQNVDPDLGFVADVVWVDGYFMTTDYTNLVVTELLDPLSVNPLKYGSSEADPDPVVALKKFRNEVYALNRYTIEVFDNVGGALFPFQRIEGAQIQKGCIGTHACCVYADGIAFLGGARNESPSIYLGVNGSANKISNHEVDTLLLNYTTTQLSQVILETKKDRGYQQLLVHLPDRTLVFDAAVATELGLPVWFVYTTTVVDFAQYRAKNFVWCYDQWMLEDPASTAVGLLDPNVGTHWGSLVRWEFGVTIIYNSGKGVIFNELELVALPGRTALGINATVTTSYSADGGIWSQDKSVPAGRQGDRARRLVWRRQGMMRQWRTQRFRGDSSTRLTILRLEAQLEQLAV